VQRHQDRRRHQGGSTGGSRPGWRQLPHRGWRQLPRRRSPLPSGLATPPLALLPRRLAHSVLPASLLPRSTPLRAFPIATSRLPRRPRPCRIDTRPGAVPLLRTLWLEPGLASLEQTHPGLRPIHQPPLRPLLRSPFCWIFYWAHGRFCSRRAKSRGRVPSLLRGDCRRRPPAQQIRLPNRRHKPKQNPGGPLLAAFPT